ncbi:MAG: hypothetical protein A2015_06215 [Spirochaetes bacterium GWF1_31_7]|nr:MAG: hypothetical protein A2015_06215 [Spirochaetes bacterium GWF1_31_7]HBI36018.1 hypothetical protein [Spirochaetia bacterium]
MTIDKDKIDKMTLALMYLTTFSEEICKEKIYRTWKGYDWDALNRLHENGFISDPVSKAKSVSLTDEGRKLSEILFKEFF